MANSNVKKVVQFNINLNSKILSKSTNEIVNTCVGKLYKQMPTKHKISLKQAAEAAKRFEDEIAFKQLKEDQYKAKAGLYASEICYQMKLRKKPVHIIPKKVQRTNNYNNNSCNNTLTIVNSDMCCPKSYSCSTKNLCPLEKYRSSSYFYSPPNGGGENLNNNALSKHFATSVHSIERAVEVTGKMHNDLIAIDKLLKSCLKVTELSTDIPAIDDQQAHARSYRVRNRKCYTQRDKYVPRIADNKKQFSNPNANNESRLDHQMRTKEVLKSTKVPNYFKPVKCSVSQTDEIQKCPNCNPSRNTNRLQTNKPKSKQILTIREHKTKSYVIIDNLKRNRIKRAKSINDFQPEHLNSHKEISHKRLNLKSNNSTNNTSSTDENPGNNFDLKSFFSELDVYKPDEPKTNRNFINAGSYF